MREAPRAGSAELPHPRRAALRPIPIIWEHRAGDPSTSPTDASVLREAVRAWLET